MNLPQKKPSKKLILILISIIMIIAVWQILPDFLAPKHSADEIINTSIQNLKNTPALSFKATSCLEIEGKQRTFGNINGELQNNGDFHIHGDILGSNIDLYQIGETTYRKDNISGNWQKTEENALIYQTALFNETNPLAQFDFTDYSSAEIINCEEKQTMAVTFCPNLSTDTITQYFSDVTYTIYCNNALQMKKAIVTGNLKNNSVQGDLQIITEFGILPENHKIKPPITEN